MPDTANRPITTYEHLIECMKADVEFLFFEENSYVIDHSLRVFEFVKHHSDDRVCQMAALLHDVFEDSSYTKQELLKRYSYGGDWGVKEALDLVEVLTRKKWETYKSYIDRVAHAGEAARWVKFADLQDNLCQCYSKMDKKSSSLCRRYLRAIKYLVEFQQEHTIWI